MSITPPQRWVRADERIHASATCQLCGVHYGELRADRACPVSTCTACQTPQCIYNGLGHGTCSLCVIGLLDGYTRPRCGYTKCTHRAIVEAPRVHYACYEHAEKKGLLHTASRHLAERISAWKLAP